MKISTAVQSFIDESQRLLTPNSVVIINGSEADSINKELVAEGVFTPLNPKKYPNSFWSRSDPKDVARVEEQTFICSKTKETAGPLNNWAEPEAMKKKLFEKMRGSMAGRTMYVVPYLMGPAGSPYSKVGFELTDSKYVVANMLIMARCGEVAITALGNSSNFVRGLHSVGKLDPAERYIAHFPEENLIISFNSNYGGNALQGKKCFALRIASTIAKKEGWLAEHMLILGITSPEGKKYYFAGALPSMCGKTNLAMLIPPELYKKRGWKVETVGDDIAWINVGPDGRLYAINPEAGFFGVAPGTGRETNPNAIDTIEKGNTIFTNTALNTEDMTPWWEGLTKGHPSQLTDWLGNSWDDEVGTKAAHPNSRFTTPAKQCPTIDPNWESPQGVPLSGIIFGVRRSSTAPLVAEALSWAHGVYLGATLASETTAAAAGKVGELRRDPMAMRPFIGYHIGEYLAHWLSFEKRAGIKLPPIFSVNWFRRSSEGKFLWPGFGENIRLLEWMIKRIEGKSAGIKTPVGVMPGDSELDLTGIEGEKERATQALALSKEEWLAEIKSQQELFTLIGDKLPKEILSQRDALAARFA